MLLLSASECFDISSFIWTAVLVSCALLVSFLTYIVTWTKARVAVSNIREPEGVKYPPVHPYLLPFVGHAISFSLNLKSLVEHLAYVTNSVEAEGTTDQTQTAIWA